MQSYVCKFVVWIKKIQYCWKIIGTFLCTGVLRFFCHMLPFVYFVSNSASCPYFSVWQ